MKKGLVIGIIVFLIVLILLFFLPLGSEPATLDESDSIFGVLTDVSESGATGTATAIFGQDGYLLTANFQNLPDPEGTDFYEGWIVGPSVISTGMVEKITDGVWENTYTSDDNLLSHTRYVLTLEPDDGNPAPAEHIIEGTMS